MPFLKQFPPSRQSKWNLIIAVLALFVSICSGALSYWTSQRVQEQEQRFTLENKRYDELKTAHQNVLGYLLQFEENLPKNTRVIEPERADELAIIYRQAKDVHTLIKNFFSDNDNDRLETEIAAIGEVERILRGDENYLQREQLVQKRKLFIQELAATLERSRKNLTQLP